MISIGVFGGTFDPIHYGHTHAASSVQNALGFDQLLFVVANDPWQKTGGRAITPAPLRLQMVRAGLSDSPGMTADDREIRRGGASYTIDTVNELLADNPGSPISLIVGADVAAGLDSWRDSDQLARLVDVVVVDRGDGVGATLAPHWRITTVTITPFVVSATDVRTRIARGQSVDGLVDPAVVKIIEANRLYDVTPND
jgi:nicotinate-nucleotide adenylyltransferase